MAFKILLIFGWLSNGASAANAANPEGSVLRTQFGVLFLHSAQIDIARNKWLHVFRYRLPEFEKVRGLQFTNFYCRPREEEECRNDHLKKLVEPGVAQTYCPKMNNHCQYLGALDKKIKDAEDDLWRHWDNVKDSVNNLIPKFQQAEVTVNSRSKRAPLGFIGTLSRSLFGTATVEDVERIKNYVNQLGLKTKNISKELMAQSKMMTSYMTKSNKRISLAMTGIQENHEYIQRVATSLQDLEKSMFLSLTGLMERLSLHSVIRQEIDEFMTGIQDLIHGKLSPILIPYSEMASTLKLIEKKMQTVYPLFHISHTDVRFYYTEKTVFFSRNNDELLITLVVPIQPYPQLFDVFRIQSFALPVNDSSMHTTEISQLPDYLAVSKSLDQFIEFSSVDFQLCFGDKEKHCPIFKAPIVSPGKSCSMALFLNNIDRIQQECITTFKTNGLKSHAMEMSHGVVLISGIKELILTCDGRIVKEKACTLCLYKIPCGCAVRMGNLAFGQIIHNCVQSSSESRLNIPNLLLLSRFFNSSFLDKFRSETAWERANPLKIPHIRFDHKTMVKLLKTDKQYETSLSKIVTKMKRREEISENELDTFTEDLEFGTSEWDNFNSIYHVLALISTIGCTLLAVVMILILLRLRRILLILALLIQPEVTEAQEWEARPSTVSTTKSVHTTMNASVGLQVLVIGALLWVLFTILRQKSRPCTMYSTDLYLHVSSPLSCEDIFIAALSVCPRDIKLTARTSVRELRVERRCFRYVFTYVCDDLKVTAAARELILPNEIPLSWFRVRKIRRLIRLNAKVFFLFKHNGVGYPIYFEPRIDAHENNE